MNNVDFGSVDEWVFAAKRGVGATERIGNLVVRVAARDWSGYMRVSVSRESEEGGAPVLQERLYRVIDGVVVQDLPRSV